MYISGKKAIQDIVKDTQLHQYLETIYLYRTQTQLIQLCQTKKVKFEVRDKVFFNRQFSDKTKYKYKYAIAKLKDPKIISLEDLLKKDMSKPIVVMDHIHDPFNMGAILRTCAAVGVHGIIIPKNKQSPLQHSAVLKASQGYSLKVNVAVVPNLHNAVLKLKKNGYWIYSTDLCEGSKNFKSIDYPEKSVLIMGNEGNGVSQILKKASDQIIHIPMQSGVDSLNVSVATGILLFEMVKGLGD